MIWKILKKLISIFKRNLLRLDTVIIYYNRSYVNCTTLARIVKVDQENINDVLDFQSNRYIAIFQSFLDKGDTGYYAYLDNKCVHRSWVISNEQAVYPHWAYPMRLNSNQNYIHFCETAPNARRMGIYSTVLSQIVQDFKDCGEILISINKKNHASIKGVKSVGFVEKERVKVLIILGIKFVKIK